MQKSWKLKSDITGGRRHNERVDSMLGVFLCTLKTTENIFSYIVFPTVVLK